MPKHIFFDLDNTLTMSRSEMTAEHKPVFERLCVSKDAIVVSGAKAEQIRTQIPVGDYFILAQHGNHALDKSGATLWMELLSEEQISVIYEFIGRLKKELALKVQDESDLVENRGSQIGYSLIGHHADKKEKYALDPKGLMRIETLKKHAGDVAHLHAIGVDVEPGGTTSIDFFLAGRNKGFNIKRLNKEKGWEAGDCLYIGDELEPGRNDESVIGVIPTKAVENPSGTFHYIEQNLFT